MDATQLIAAAREDLRLWDAIGKPRALELIAALEAMQWRDIATAPAFQDEGIKILAYNRVMARAEMATSDGDWWRARLRDRGSLILTHWMPLPAPPQAPEAAQEADHG
jgi:hypothetical protein